MNEAEPPRRDRGRHLMLYDGVCGLCNRVNRFVLRRDRQRLFDFAPLQSPTGRRLLARIGRDPEALDTFYVIADYQSGGTVLSRAGAALFVLDALGAPWRALSAFRILPLPLLNLLYNLVARYRYQVFGRFDVCPLPSPEERERFIDT